MGLCVGKSHFLDDEPSEYTGYGHYVEKDYNGLYLPSTNNEKIEELSSKLGLNRNIMASFIIPYPIKNYAASNYINQMFGKLFHSY